MDLFEQRKNELAEKNAPLANRMRPQTLEQYIGQEHIIGAGRLLRRAIAIDQLSSIIFYGPPGTGKTTLARIIANTTKAQFLNINAVLAGVKDIREAIKNAEDKLSLYSQRTILFIDEVHRFNKAQQDALLPHVENGTITLIGATTENPYFEVNKALVSRSRIFQLEPLTEKDLIAVAKQALSDKKRGYGDRDIKINDDAISHLVNVANGDARGVLNALELAVETTEKESDGSIIITREVIEESIQKKAVLYDKDGDAHYDTISAFIKSVRGSDPDASLYWMAKMLYAGEDPKFIFRRLLILASEDIGLADPNALGFVMDCAKTFDYIGMPEGRFPLTQAVLYLATAPKSNSTLCFFDALRTVKEEQSGDIPNPLKDASRDKDGFGHGAGYLYPHAYRDHWVAQQYLPTVMQGKTFYEPSNQGYEKKISTEVTRKREAKLAAMIDADDNLLNPSPIIPDHFQNSSLAWKKRSDGERENSLEKIRDQIFEIANISESTNPIILDITGKTGLLTFEAVRRFPEGAIWSIASDNKSFETLTNLSAHFSPLSRPQVIQSKLSKISKNIKLSAGENVKLDLIIGRNALVNTEKRELLLKSLISILSQNGSIVLAENLHKKSQRLSELVEFPNSELKNSFIKAEDKFYSNSKNPKLTLDTKELIKSFEKDSNLKIQVTEQASDTVRYISTYDVNQWFKESKSADRLTLGDFLNSELKKEELSKIRELLIAQLSDKNISWKSTILFLKITI